MFLKAIVSVDVESVEVMHDVKPDEVNDDGKSCAQPIVVEVDVRE